MADRLRARAGIVVPTVRRRRAAGPISAVVLGFWNMQPGNPRAQEEERAVRGEPTNQQGEESSND